MSAPAMDVVGVALNMTDNELDASVPHDEEGNDPVSALAVLFERGQCTATICISMNELNGHFSDSTLGV